MQSLTTRKDFDALFATGDRRRSGDLTILRVATGGDGMTKVAVVAGKRVGNAVARNRAKRRIREGLRQVDLPTGEHIAVIAGPSVPGVPFDTILSWLRGGLRARA